ncbi:hypothetical protein DCC85_03345 [Paenibacillus sp. CAA11]|uniref:DUF4179 domain-containing protein n=1 Tax=Paenibacillus sp. CAA11 TaxID=1532905 RepID=UPI000D37361B|nr:DUF4179 domain-containing protein [Paenibacillus sp. CAA11]AWB43351.1 hypothetical protein DCC85_03345 [Paenibacillus sp. CAA11]
MKVFDVDKELREIGKEPLPEVPEMIRRRQDEVYASLVDLPMRSRSGQTSKFRRTRKAALVTAAAAMIALIGGLGGAIISPAMADSLKNIPLIGGIFKLANDMGLQIADERGLTTKLDASVTHEGITLSIPQIVYDGTRVSLAVTREGEGLFGTINDVRLIGNGQREVYPRGAIKSTDFWIDGKSIADHSGGREFSLGSKGTSDPNSVIYELSGFPRSGETEEFLPDEFELKVEFRLEGIAEPYSFNIPVRKNVENMTQSFQEVREWRGNQVTLEQIQFSPITARVSINIRSSDKEAKLWRDRLLFEVWDDRGRKLGLVSGVGGYTNDDQMELHNEVLFEGFTDTPETVTLKAFIPEKEDPLTFSGAFKVDSHGELIKNYIEELEMTVQVDRTRLEKIYQTLNK